jgi:hypothetical protein
MATQTKAQVKALQTALNKKGAKLVVDGIAGKLTNAAIAKYNSVPTISTSSGSSSSNKTTPKSTTYSKMSKPGQKMTYASSFPKVNPVIPTVSKKSSSNSPLGMFANWLKTKKDSITTGIGGLGSSAQKNKLNADGTPYEPFYNFKGSDYQIKPKVVEASDYVAPTPFEVVSDFGGQVVDKTTDVLNKAGDTIIDKLSSTTTYDSQTDNPTTNSQTMDLSLGLPSTPLSGDNTSGTTTTTKTDTLADGTVITTDTPEAPMALNSMGVSSGNPMVNNNGINNALTGLDTKVGAINNDPFISDKTKADRLKVTETNLTNELANNFQSYDQLNSWLNTAGGADKLRLINQKNGTNLSKESILAKITPAINGLTQPKTTAEFLAYQNKAVEDERKLFNEQIALENNWTQNQKDILLGKKDADGNDILLGVAEQQKKENDAMSAFLDKQLANQEMSLKKKAQYAIDKAESEFKAKDAETEMNRIQAKNNLTEFLAKIGALRTDGNALTGLETLEQRYQAQRQSLAQDFSMAKREITMNMNDNIYNLESARDEKVFKLNQDLTKTEREVLGKTMELDYNLQKDMLAIKTKWTDAIRTEKDKAEAKAEKASQDWTSQFFTISGAEAFKGTSKEFQAEWQNNNRWGKQPNGYKTPEQQVGQQFLDYQKTQPKESDITETTMQKVRQYLKKENKNTTDYNEALSAFESDAEYRNDVLGSLK